MAWSDKVAQDQLREINSRATAAKNCAAHVVISKNSTADRQKHRATSKETDRITDKNRPCGKCALQHSQGNRALQKAGAKYVINSTTSQRYAKRNIFGFFLSNKLYDWQFRTLYLFTVQESSLSTKYAWYTC